MLKFTNPRPQHTPQTTGREGRKEAASQLCQSLGLLVPQSAPWECRPQPQGLRASPLFWECSNGRFVVSIMTPGNPCSPLSSPCRCGPAEVGGRETLLASLSNLTRNTPRGRSKLYQQSLERLSRCSGTEFEEPGVRDKEQDPSAHPSARGQCGQARDPLCYAKTWHLQPGAEQAAWGQGPERGKSSPASTHPRRISRAP